jgi:hypothetical protein
MTRSKKILCLIYIPTHHRGKIKIPPCPPLTKGGWGDLRVIALILGLVFFLSAIWGCDYARMNDQESVRTYKKEIPDMPPETIPITGGVQKLSSANPKDLRNPAPYTQESVDQGKEAYCRQT